jgi:importin subunit beta-1
MLMLAGELVNETSSIHVRNAAGLALKNALSARVRHFLSPIPLVISLTFVKESTRQTEYSARWLALDADSKAKIKQAALMTLGSPSQKAGMFAAQVVAAIAAVELPEGHWPELIELLLGFIHQNNNTLKVATLQTIGFICETIVSLESASLRHRLIVCGRNPRS